MSIVSALVVLGVGALAGALLYRAWDYRRREQRQAAIDADRWRRLEYLLQVLADVFAEFEAEVRPGVTPAALAAFMEEGAHRRGVRSSVRNFRAFPAPACLSVNEVFLNAVPGHQPLVVGDLLNVQFGVTDGLAYAHQAWAYSVGEPSPEQARLLKAGVEALAAATRVASGAARVGDISQRIEEAALANGCKPDREFVGCGIWRQPFEPPQIPCYVRSEHASERLRPGMVLLVQAILHAGGADVEVAEDQWAVRSKDRKPAVAMSRMLHVGKSSARPLTELRAIRLTNSTRGSDEVV